MQFDSSLRDISNAPCYVNIVSVSGKVQTPYDLSFDVLSLLIKRLKPDPTLLPGHNDVLNRKQLIKACEGHIQSCGKWRTLRKTMSRTRANIILAINAQSVRKCRKLWLWKGEKGKFLKRENLNSNCTKHRQVLAQSHIQSYTFDCNSQLATKAKNCRVLN